MSVRKRLIAYVMCYVMAFAALPVSVAGAEVGTDSENSLSGTVSITGELRVGETLTAVTTNVTGPEVSDLKYQWYQVGDTEDQNVDISGATGSAYTLANSDAGKKIGVKVTAESYDGSVTAETTDKISQKSIAGTVSITGELRVGETLTAVTTNVTGPEVSDLKYQWYQVGDTEDQNVDISGATGSAYTLANSDAGKKIGVKVTAESYDGSVTAETTDKISQKITGSLSIISTTGKMQYGDCLTVSGVSSSDVLVEYEWYRVEKNENGDEIK